MMAIEDLSLDEGEKVEWHKGQGTFHRGYDFGLAVTNKAICIYMRRYSFSPKWIKIPITDVDSIELSEAKIYHGFLSLMGIGGHHTYLLMESGDTILIY